MCDADAFLAISDGMDFLPEDLAVWDQNNPAYHGKDYIQRPLMQIVGGNDFIYDSGGNAPYQTEVFDADNTNWMNPITKAYGLNNAPSYGVVIDGANHITPVSQFFTFSSAEFGTLWDQKIGNLLSGILGSTTKVNLYKESTTSVEDDYLLNDLFADLVVAWLRQVDPIVWTVIRVC